MTQSLKEMKVLCLVLVFCAAPCFGYIDPGMGAFIWQSLIAIGAGVAFHVLRLLRTVRRKQNDSADPMVEETHGSDKKELRQAA